jgi:hypothetical protein
MCLHPDLIYNGTMGTGARLLHLYTDKQTGTTFSVLPGEDVIDALNKKRAEFSAYKKGE